MKSNLSSLASVWVAGSSVLRLLSRTRAFAAALTCTVTLGLASGQVGTNYCAATPNSTGATATISGTGSASVALNNLTLASANLPLNSAAYFVCSRDQGFVQNPGGSAGNLCLGGAIGRRVGGLIPNSGATGMVSVLADLTALPQPSGAVVVQAGETWSFQCWYRDTLTGGGTTSNFSDGLEVLFTLGGNPIPGMMPIPPGTFAMGSDAPNTAPYFNTAAQRPVHQVTISYPFWMGRHEVTQAEFQALTGVNPSNYLGATRPVERVNWYRARAYCAALTAQEAANLPPGYEYRLPTEAEWEYACRGGTATEFHYGPELLCNQGTFWSSTHSNTVCSGGFVTGTTTVGSFAPNAFGLYDMHGNVREWCLDSDAPYSAAAVVDPFVTGGSHRICRGGSWLQVSSFCRSAARFPVLLPEVGDFLTGFRVVLAPALVP